MTAPALLPAPSAGALLVDSAAVAGFADELRAAGGDVRQQSADADAEVPALARALAGEVGVLTAEVAARWAEVCAALADQLLVLGADVDAALLAYRSADDGLSNRLGGPR